MALVCNFININAMTTPQEIAIPEHIFQAEVSPNNLNKTTIQISSSDLPSQVRNSEGHMQNRSMRHSTGFKPKGGQRSKQFMQLGNACPLNSFKRESSDQREFRHPWAMSVKSRSIRIKTDRNRRNSTQLTEQMIAKDQGKEQKVIHSLRVKQDKIVKKVPLFDDQHMYRRLKTDHKKWYRIQKQQNFIKQQMQQRQSQRQSEQDLIDVVNKKEEEAKKQRQKKRQSIIDQRMQKQKAVENVHKEKADYAFRQRLASYQLKTERKEVEDYQMYEKRLLYQRQKQEKLNKKQQKRSQSQSHSKWISDFDSISRAKPSLTEKQHAFAQKMKIAIISLSQRQSPS